MAERSFSLLKPAPQLGPEDFRDEVISTLLKLLPHLRSIARFGQVETGSRREEGFASHGGTGTLGFKSRR